MRNLTRPLPPLFVVVALTALLGVSGVGAQSPAPDVALPQAPPQSFVVYLPAALRTLVACPSTAPVPLSPANGNVLDTIAPLFQWNNGANPGGTGMRLQVATSADFAVVAHSMRTSVSPGVKEFRFGRNLEPGTTYYWRVFFLCGAFQGPYSQVQTFTTAFTGTMLPGPAQVAPADGSVLTSWPVTLQWSAVSGALEYYVTWRVAGQLSERTRFASGTQTNAEELSANTTYEWWVRARNGYAIGDRSEVWTFTTPPAP
jgi:hypothetical protein